MELFDVYSLYDIEPVIGKGNYVYDSDGNEYLDLYGGHAVISIGHSHPHYINAINEQVDKLGFYSNSVKNSLQHKLADLLGRLSGYDDYRLFLCNSGAEANENAIKVASFATGKSKVLAFHNAFHGRTSGAVAATDNPKIISPFNSTDNVKFVNIGDIDAVEKELSSREYCAILIEGIQGVAGIVMPGDDFLIEVGKIAKKYGVLFIIDEIQSGYGRTGKLFAHQYAKIKADIVTMAKGIANGFPVGAVLISPEIQAKKGMLGTTFGGNHLACAAAIATAEVMESENLIDNAAKTGEYLINELKKFPELLDVRGRGLMIGIEISGSGTEMRKKLLFDKKIFTGGAGQSTIRLLPALSLSIIDAKKFIDSFKAIISL